MLRLVFPRRKSFLFFSDVWFVLAKVPISRICNDELFAWLIASEIGTRINVCNRIHTYNICFVWDSCLQMYLSNSGVKIYFHTVNRNNLKCSFTTFTLNRYSILVQPYLVNGMWSCWLTFFNICKTFCTA